MRIGYFADGPWAYNCFDRIVASNNFQISFIVPRFDSKDVVLRQKAEKYNIPVFTHKNINSKEFINQIRKYDCDIFVSMSFNQIFKTEIINIPYKGSINCHAGKLPFYRGRNVLNWALINDEASFGITVHYIDESIDTGDIILQREYPITDDDDYSTLLDVAYRECAEVLFESLALIQDNRHKPIKQITIDPVGFYCGRRRSGDELIDWTQSSRDVFNFIRAICPPGPSARTYVEGELEVFIHKSKYIETAPIYKGICGQVLSLTNNGFIVKTGNSFIEIVDYDLDAKLRVGDRLTCQK